MAYSLMGGGMLQPNPAAVPKTAQPPVTPLPEPRPGAMAKSTYDNMLMTGSSTPAPPVAKGGMAAPGQGIDVQPPISTQEAPMPRMQAPPMSVDEATARPGMEQLIAGARQWNEESFGESAALARRFGVNSGEANQAMMAFRQLAGTGRFNGSMQDFFAQRFGGRQPRYLMREQRKDFGQGTFNGGPGNTVQPQNPIPPPNDTVGGPTVQPQNQGPNQPGPTSMQPGNYGNGNGPTVQPQPAGQGVDPYRPMGGTAIEAGNIPGQTADPSNVSGYRDTNTNYLNLMGDRDVTEFGGGNLGGNTLFQGNWSSPDFLRNSAGRYGEANTNAVTRGVGDGELVENRLARLTREDNELNRIAKEGALAQSAASGMLGSGVAAGAALRASRQAMMPIAQQDAQTEFNTASQNMDAQNRDALADQQNRTGLLSQEIGTEANLLDSATNRAWQSRENNTNQAFQLMRDDLGFRRDLIGQDRGFNFQNLDREDRQLYEAGQQEAQNSLQLQLQQNDQQFAGNQQERQFRQQRTMAYYDMIYGREGLLGNTLAQIYSNPNLTAEQQRAAVTNAQGFYRSLFESSNQTFANGVPEIFTDPYPQQPTQPPPNGPPANPPNPTPPTGG